MLHLTENGYYYLEEYLKELYGERGSYRHNLKRYANSDEFYSSCHIADSIDDMDEISLDLLKYTVDRENNFKRLCEDVIRMYDEYDSNHQLSFDHIYKVAGILGLAPGCCDWSETLLPHVCDLFFDSREAVETEGHELEERIRHKQNLFDVMVRITLDGMRKGQILENSIDERRIFSQGYVRNLWRGESAYYGCSKASMYRHRPENDEEAFVHDLICNLKIFEFSMWLESLDFVKQWPYGDIFHGAIAQHYGIPTNAIDVTGDLKTAIFFACSTYDSEMRMFRKLEEKEYALKDSRKDIAALNGDSRYGVIFKAPYDVINMSLNCGEPSLHFTSAFPIGYQPFMRCGNQNGFVIETGYPFDLYRDGCFGKFKIRLCSEIIDWIFEEMEGGYNIYPCEAFGSIDDIVEKIRHSRSFSAIALEKAIEHMGVNINQNDIIVELKKIGIDIYPDMIKWCSQTRKEELEQRFWTNEDKLLSRLPESKFRIRFSI